MNVNFNELEIDIVRRPDRYDVEIWLFVRGTDDTTFINYNGKMWKETKIPIVEVPPNELKPFLRLPSRFADQLFKAIADFNANRGIKSKDENLIEGKLQATEKHLKDMQEFSKQLLNFVTFKRNDQGT